MEEEVVEHGIIGDNGATELKNPDDRDSKVYPDEEKAEIFKLPLLPGNAKPVASKVREVKGQGKDSQTIKVERQAVPCDSNIKVTENDKADQDRTVQGTSSSSSINDSATRVSDASSRKQVEKAGGVPYTEPSWGARCQEPYYFEVIKNGCVVKNVELNGKSFFVAGRLETCDIKLEHPSSSRYHAVLQYKGSVDETKGFYVYDLGSTHGTVVNKVQVNPKKYFRLHVGFVVKFGGSSRMYVLQGPEYYDEEKEESLSDHTTTNDVTTDDKSKESMTDNASKEGNDGIDWGFGEDAVEEETDIEKLIENRPPLELKDPKKTLRGFFEREGLDLEYEDEEKGKGGSKTYLIKVRLPIETVTGEDMYAEATASKKKDAVLACAIRACQMLDAHGLLRNAEHESVRAKRRKVMEENDFYDSDEDNFLDRTGSVERKRKMRMEKAGKAEEVNAESYDSLVKKAEDIQQKMNRVLARMEDLQSGIQGKDEDDSLEAYMNQMNAKLSKDALRKAGKELKTLEKSKEEVDRLIKICRPPDLPPLSRSTNQQIPPKVKQGPDKTGIDPKKSHETKPPLSECKAESLPKELSPSSVQEPQGRLSETTVDISNQDEKTATASMQPPIAPIGKKNKKKKRVYGAPNFPQSADHSQFSDWTPPQGQSGDGMTKLNEKYGY